jgi:isocitrate/isopropylmalate dehydrogenase
MKPCRQIARFPPKPPVLDVLGSPFDWEVQQGGMAAIERSGDPLPGVLIVGIRRTRLALKGPLTTSVRGGFRSVGDILSDQMSGLVGGPGMAPGANIGEKAAIFEAVHGSAPDIAGKGIANPLALLLAAWLMLKHVDRNNLATRLRTAIEQTLQIDNLQTADLGGKVSTADFAGAVIKRLAA